MSCAVNVICELANKNPKNYLAMAPKFFRLLTTSSNNWMLIKVNRNPLNTCMPADTLLAKFALTPLVSFITTHVYVNHALHYHRWSSYWVPWYLRSLAWRVSSWSPSPRLSRTLQLSRCSTSASTRSRWHCLLHGRQTAPTAAMYRYVIRHPVTQV